MAFDKRQCTMKNMPHPETGTKMVPIKQNENGTTEKHVAQRNGVGDGTSRM